MLLRTDPFRDFTPRPAVAPLDAYRDGDAFFVHIDLPGVDPGSIDATVDRNVLTIKAERTRPGREGVDRVITERRSGPVTRRLLLGDALDSDSLEATYDAGVLTLRIPVAERAKPRKIEIKGTPELVSA